MTIRGFDVGTAGFVLSLIALALIITELTYSIDTRAKTNRMEETFKAYCAGDTKIEVCAQLDLPLDLDKFK